MKSHAINRWMVRLATCILVLVIAIAAYADNDASDSGASNSEVAAKAEYKPKTDAELKKTLSAMQYNVTQKESTEPPFKNLYWDNKKGGEYRCIVCELPLFSSETKYKSGTGWPSFYAPENKDSVGLRTDWRLIYSRTEVHCKRCNAHLGHVFDDGPQPTGKRYCMNSASLKFIEKKDNVTAKDGPASKGDAAGPGDAKP